MGGCQAGDGRAAVRADAARAVQLWAGRLLAALWLTGLAVATGCASSPDSTAAHRDGDQVNRDTPSGILHLLVASSLLPVAEELAVDFEQLYPSLEVQISAAGSSALREQVLAGAPADVFVPADPAHLETIRDEIGLATEPLTVARNSLVLAVPKGNDAQVTSLADLARPELLIGLCAAEVPCGAHARAGLSVAGIEPASDTDEPNARALLTKLIAGELDAAVVYASDAAAAESIESLGWPAGTAPQTSYHAAVVPDAPNPHAASAFVEYLQSAPAQDALRAYGFGAP